MGALPHAPVPQTDRRRRCEPHGRGPGADPGHCSGHSASAGGSPTRAAAQLGQSGQKHKLPPRMEGLGVDVASGCLPRPLTWSLEECSETIVWRRSPPSKPCGDTTGNFAREPPLPRLHVPPLRPILGREACRPRGRVVTVPECLLP